jgi:hypothetical protein
MVTQSTLVCLIMNLQNEVPLEGQNHQFKPSNSTMALQYGSGLSHKFLAPLLGVNIPPFHFNT